MKITLSSSDWLTLPSTSSSRTFGAMCLKCAHLSHLRRALYMPALVGSRCDPHMKPSSECFWPIIKRRTICELDNNRYCWVVYFSDGFIVRVRAYLDSVAVVELFEENPVA
jgi:hypothetical protein